MDRPSDKRRTALETATALPALLALNRRAKQAAEDLALEQPLPPHHAEAIAPSAVVGLRPVVIAAVVATALDAVHRQTI